MEAWEEEEQEKKCKKILKKNEVDIQFGHACFIHIVSVCSV